MSLKHDNYIKNKKNVTIFLGEKIKMTTLGLPRICVPSPNKLVSQHQKTPQVQQLLEAVQKKKVNQVKTLIKNGISVNATDKQGWSLLHLAVRQGNLEMVRLLLDNKVDVNAKNKLITLWNVAALHEAASRGHLDIARLLLDKGADVNITDEHGRTPLQYAVMYNRTDIVRLLFAKRAKINTIDKLGRTPLQEAIDKNHEQIANILLDHPDAS